MIDVSALFVRKDSVYKSLGIDCWDIDRDARKWPGGNSVIAHPPCRAWGQLSHFAKPRPDEKQLAVWSIEQIRRYGGVLEHPRASKLWPFMGLLLPGKGKDEYGGYSLCVNQSWWGHPAEKKTFLYIVGCHEKCLPDMPLNLDAIQYTISSKVKLKSGRRSKRELSKKQREVTPVEFAKWLVEVARICNKNINTEKTPPCAGLLPN